MVFLARGKEMLQSYGGYVFDVARRRHGRISAL